MSPTLPVTGAADSLLQFSLRYLPSITGQTTETSLSPLISPLSSFLSPPSCLLFLSPLSSLLFPLSSLLSLSHCFTSLCNDRRRTKWRRLLFNQASSSTKFRVQPSFVFNQQPSFVFNQASCSTLAWVSCLQIRPIFACLVIFWSYFGHLLPNL